MRILVTIAGGSRACARASAARVCGADAVIVLEPASAPRAPVRDFAKPLRSTCIRPPSRRDYSSSVTRVETYRIIFTLAGLYNIVFGLWAALAPRAFFWLVDLGEPAHPAIWACLGMVVGLYGLIYLQVAYTDPARRSSALLLGGRRFEY